LPTATPDLLAAVAAGGPTTVFNLSPESGTVSRQRISFTWTPDQPLAPGQVFELAFWLPGQGPELGVGWTDATTDTTLAARGDEQIPGDYLWGIWLGTYVNGGYQRIRFLGGGNSLSVGAESEPERGSGPGQPAETPPPPDCPPSAPCRP
jgi:hypothetical protein